MESCLGVESSQRQSFGAEKVAENGDNLAGGDRSGGIAGGVDDASDDRSAVGIQTLVRAVDLKFAGTRGHIDFAVDNGGVYEF